ncbi:unnamed protein product [Brachionus calyciflorus]|uniref:Glycerol-3-phosphate dehydrogenase n=1 Tax=Brachionus calyciflorus TaxID=104777 RepID=A0A814BDI4_9BILA|nr:unnamed protein product [Brachionus calyciflorus]
MRVKTNKKIVTALACAAGGALGLGAYTMYREQNPVLHAAAKPPQWLAELPSREEQVEALSKTPEYDMLIIGGGATGAGCAVDAAGRGLKTALVEKYDFSSGTSSRSTKLIHGGVRYLQKAIMQFDIEQYKMVKEALYERANLIEIAPHLSYPFPIMLPVYKLWQIPYYWVGIKAYDLVAGRQLLKPSYYISKTTALELFPMLKKESLCGAIVYYDGQHNDARMNISLAMTAARLGATVANHVAVTELIHETDENGNKRTTGAKCIDRYTGKEFTIRAKSIVNATGPYTDLIRKMDNEKNLNICQPSSGVHIVLPDYYSPQNMGLLDPSTSDGRVIFFLPWQKHTMAGTTDTPCALTDYPTPSEEDVNFIINEIKNYLNNDVQVRRGDVMSAWSGIRPLVSDPNKPDTQSLARNHIVHVSDSKLITIAGGKWTTYRSMAEETVDAAIKACGLKPKNGCITKGLFLEGGHNWTPTSYIRLAQDYGIETEVAIHLSNTYGDQADRVAELSSLTGKRWPVVGVRLHEEFPYIDAEVKYAVKEYARTAVDVIARRTRMSFLNVLAADEALPKIVEIMAAELKWNKQKQQEELERAKEFLKREMGLNLKYQMKTTVPINFSKEEISTYIKRFRSLDSHNKGYITHKDLRAFFKETDEQIPEDELHLLLTEVDTNKNGLIELDEFLQLMSALKTGAIGQARFPKASSIKNKINTTRSGASFFLNISNLEKRRFIKEKASVSDEPGRKIISQYVAELKTHEEIVNSPSEDADRQAINRAKKKTQPSYPPEPESLALINIPDELKFTLNDNHLFLIYDSGEKEIDRFFIFGNVEHLNLLENGQVFADATFDIAPKHFSQVYALHVHLNNQSFAIIYAILPRKTEKIYFEFLQVIKSKIAVDPSSISCDYELAFIIGFIIVHCYIPSDDVVEIFNLIKPKLDLTDPIEFQINEFNNYFEESYVEKYLIELWSIHKRLIDDIPRTTNYCESWHNAFGNMLKKHPNVYCLIDSLRHENKKIENKLLKARTGLVVSRKRDDVILDERIKELLKDYSKENFEDFFDKIALLLKF